MKRSRTKKGGRRQELLRTKRKLEALLPLVGPERHVRMRERLIRIAIELRDPVGPQLTDFHKGIAGLSKIDGVGGLQFQAQAPPGVGRLIRLPFYVTDSPTFVTGSTNFIDTDGGTNVPAIQNPVAIARLVTRAQGGIVCTTPVLEWATLRIVGFQASAKGAPSLQSQDNDLNPTMRPLLLASQLLVGGGANLFPQEGYVDATIYTPFVPEFAGLRSYPIIRSPNNASVRLAVMGQPGNAFGAEDYQCTFSANLVCEILEDKNFGRHIPGPYARVNAIARDTYPDGTSFVNQ